MSFRTVFLFRSFYRYLFDISNKLSVIPSFPCMFIWFGHIFGIRSFDSVIYLVIYLLIWLESRYSKSNYVIWIRFKSSSRCKSSKRPRIRNNVCISSKNFAAISLQFNSTSNTHTQNFRVYTHIHTHTYSNRHIILVKSIKIRLYLLFYDWFRTKRNTVRC